MATWGQTNQHKFVCFSCVWIKYVTFRHVFFFFLERNCLPKDSWGVDIEEGQSVNIKVSYKKRREKKTADARIT